MIQHSSNDTNRDDESCGDEPNFARTRASHSESQTTTTSTDKVSTTTGLDLASQEEGASALIAYADDLLERARTQWQFGDWDSLCQLRREVLQHKPNRARLSLLAVAGHSQHGTMEDAREFARLAMEWGCDTELVLRVLIAGVHNSLGRAEVAVGRPSHALTHFESAISVGTPTDDVRLITQARVEHQLKQLRVSRQWIDSFNHARRDDYVARAEGECRGDHLGLRPTDSPEEFNCDGEALYRAGHYKLAAEYFRAALDLHPDDAWICQNLAESVARLTVKKGEQWRCEQLGEVIAKTGKWDVAVRYYRKALKIDRVVVDRHRRAQCFNVEPVYHGHVEHPVFIVGCGHSGTSLLLAILGHHPNIYPIPKESGLFLRTDAVLNKTMRSWDTECEAQGKSRWVEKTPPHIFQIHRFLSFRPNARFILMLRDGRDVVCSLRSRTGYASFEDRMDRWVYDNLAGLPYWHHPQVKVVKYEDLVTDPKKTLRIICNFIGEVYTDDLLSYHKEKRCWYSDRIAKPSQIIDHNDHLNNRNWQINQPLFDGRGRWLGEMSEEEKFRFKDSVAQEWLEYMGYVPSRDW